MNKFLKNREVQGEMIMVFENMIWAFFPIITILAITVMPTIFTAAISTLLAGVFMAVMLTVRKEWHQIKVKGVWKEILIATFLIGVVFYLLFFIGLESTTAGNASIIALMEVFFSMLILGLWKKEKQSLSSVLGGTLMVTGAVIVLFKGEFSINKGDLIILIATMMPPIGNYFVKRARKKVGSTYIMFVRSIIGGIVLLGFAFLLEDLPTISQINSSIFFLLINGFILLGFSKILWMEAIHRISITKATSLIAIGPIFTLIFAFFILGEVPTVWQITGFIPVAIGIYIITELRKMKV